MKIGDIVKCKNIGQLGIIIGPYESKAIYDWEVMAIKQPFEFGHVWQDCFMEESLELYDWKDYPKTFWEKLKLLFKVN